MGMSNCRTGDFVESWAGLAHEPVTIRIYEGQIKIEYQATTLAEYEVERHEKSRLRRVPGGRLVETPFRSAQLALFDLADGWLLYLPAPSHAPHRP